MLIRVGSRGSRLALTQAELASSHLRAPGIEIALVPITTAGDNDRTKPFGEIGSRGVFVKELEEALLEHRIDVAVHSAKDMTSSDPEGLVVGAYLERDDPRDALCGAAEIRPGMRVGTASARRKAQLLALEPTLSIEPLRGNIDTRLRKRGERGLDAVVLAACGLDRLGLGREIGRRFDPDELLPGSGAGRARAPGARRRGAPRRRSRPRRDAPPRRGRARRGCDRRRRLPRAGRGPPRRHDARRADRRGGRLVDRAAQRRRPGRARARARPARAAVRVVVTRAEAQAEPLVARLEALGHEVVRCPLIRIEPLGDEPVDAGPYDWVVVTSPNGAAELARRLAAPPRRLAAIGPATEAELRAHGLHADVVAEVATQEGLLAELPRPAGRVLFAAGEQARRWLVGRARRRLPAALPHRRAAAAAPPTATSRCSPPPPPRAAFAATGARLPVVAIGPQTARAAREAGLEVVPKPRRTTSTASSRRSSRFKVEAMPAFITFLTDFGLQDDFVGTCHGVIKRIAPEAEIIDLTHGIRPGRILQGALTLANALPYMPVGVHLAVVDPGVGGGRRPLALRDVQGRLYVGPDNGLLLPAADRFGGVADVHELANPAYALESVSRTFHGRDLFSPAAAHLALGVPLAELGPPIDPDALVRLELPEPEVGNSRIRATVLGIDRFGNVALNLTREHLEQASIVPGTRVELVSRGERYFAVAARTFGDARAGDLLVYEDSYRNVAVAVSQGSAAALLGVEEGSDLILQVDAV